MQSPAHPRVIAPRTQGTSLDEGRRHRQGTEGGETAAYNTGREKNNVEEKQRVVPKRGLRFEVRGERLAYPENYKGRTQRWFVVVSRTPSKGQHVVTTLLGKFPGPRGIKKKVT